jgi:GTP-binding protein HflX
VLHEIGAAEVPQLLVFNKTDALPPGQQPRQRVDHFEVDGVQLPRVFASSQTGVGLPQLRQQLARIVAAQAPPAVAPQSETSA